MSIFDLEFRSLGVVLYQLLVGDFTRPLTTDWARDIPDSLLQEDLQHCFAGKPEERFAGAAQVARHLRSLPQRRADLARQQAELAAREKAAYRRGIVRAASLPEFQVKNTHYDSLEEGQRRFTPV